MTRDWLGDAIVYEIYPQSYADSNGDGIGDLRGVIERLDHIESLGVNTIWFNPCFASPFVDAGYDVSDYMRIAPRYGTNDDLIELVEKSAQRGIRVLLDLVAGHTSIEHPWFQAELQADGPSPEGDRYIWCEELPAWAWDATIPGTPGWVPSPGPRKGWYLKNFFDEQPALNFGWTETPKSEPWRDGVTDPGPMRNREMLREVLDFWLSKGIAGFRVDMAFSLVKDHRGKNAGTVATTQIWRDLHAWLASAHPDAVLIPEGVEPRTGLGLGFDADFFLVIHAEHASLFDNQGAGVLPFQQTGEAFFDADGKGTPRTFLDGWTAAKADDPARPVIMATADHDFSRLRTDPRTPEQLGAALMFLFTWGTVPSLYYGDEIGMRYLPGLPEVEGSMCNPGYNRAGCRTPMQWDDSPNAGFSAAAAGDLYLPIDPSDDRPTVTTQEQDPDSTLHLVRRLIALRRATPALGGRASTTVLHEGYPLTWRRGDSHVVVVNPRREPAEVEVDGLKGATVLLGQGVELTPDGVRVDGFGYGALELA